MMGLLALGMAFAMAGADKGQMEITITAEKQDRVSVPVSVPLTLDKDVAELYERVQVLGPAKVILIGQLTGPALGSETKAPPGKVRRDLHFIVSRLEAGRSVTFRPLFGARQPDGGPDNFVWKKDPGRFTELRRGDRPVLRYVYEALDDSTKERREETYKVFHHLFDPAGKRLVTKGPGGLYTHHRGLFYGFRKCTYGDGIEVDTWHCTNDTYQGHDGFGPTEAGPVLGRHRVLISWHGKKKEVFAREEREVTIWSLPGGTLVEWASQLASTGGRVHLDGDPQHAGLHFRADNEVADRTKSQTVFTRPDGADAPGKTRNWPDNKDHVNLPFDAMTFVLGDTKYTAAYLDRPDNPKEARFSERDYGRFGSYFVRDVVEKSPLLVRYRVWLQEGPITVEELRQHSINFVGPLHIEVKSTSGR
jgi:hypothetical protein